MSPVDEHVDQILLSPAEALAAVRADEQQGALLSLALRHLEATNAYADDGTVSMSAWLRNHARMSSKDATSLLSTGRYLDSNPAFAEAAITGRLSAGQVGIAKQLGHPKYSALLSDLQEELAEILAPLSYADTQVAVAKWRNDADAVLDDGDGTPRHLPNISISADITTLTTNAPRATNDERRTTNDDRRQTTDDRRTMTLADPSHRPAPRPTCATARSTSSSATPTVPPKPSDAPPTASPARCSDKSPPATAAADSQAATAPSDGPTATTSTTGNTAAPPTTATSSTLNTTSPRQDAAQ